MRPCPDCRVTASAGMKFDGADLESVLGELAERHRPAVSLGLRFRRSRIPRSARRPRAWLPRSPRPWSLRLGLLGFGPLGLPSFRFRHRRGLGPRLGGARLGDKRRAARRRPRSERIFVILASLTGQSPRTRCRSSRARPRRRRAYGRVHRKSMAARWAKLGALILQR